MADIEKLELSNITQDTVVAEFVDIYNDNNGKILNSLNEIIHNLVTLNRAIKQKLSADQIDDKIYKSIADADGKNNYMDSEAVQNLVMRILSEQGLLKK